MFLSRGEKFLEVCQVFVRVFVSRYQNPVDSSVRHRFYRVADIAVHRFPLL